MSVLVATLDSEVAGAILICSTSMRPLPLPVFADDDDAHGFLAFAEELGFADVRRLRADSLELVHSMWISTGRPKEVDEVDDEIKPVLQLVTARTR